MRDDLIAGMPECEGAAEYESAVEEVHELIDEIEADEIDGVAVLWAALVDRIGAEVENDPTRTLGVVRKMLEAAELDAKSLEHAEASQCVH